MLKLKKFLAVSLAAAMTGLSLVGCQSKAGTTSSTASTATGTPTKITWYAVYSAVPDDVSRIDEAASKYLQSKGLNVDLDLQILTWSDYNTQISTMISSGESFDLLNTTVSTINSYAKSGGFTEITSDMLSSYGPDIVSSLGQNIIDLADLNGVSYSIPVNKDTADYSGYIYNKDIADKYKIDVSGVKSMDDWTAIFKKLHAEDPDIICYLPSTFDPIINANVMYVNGSSALCAGLYLNNDSTKAFNYFEEDSVKKVYETLHSWYKAGYLNKDTTADTTELKNEGKVFVYPYSLKPGVAAELSTGTTTWGQIETSSAYRSIRNFPGGWATGIPASSKNPELALQVLNMAYKDSAFLNLIIYGEEGTDYTLTSDNQVSIASNAGYNISGYAWEWGNQFIEYTTAAEDTDLWTQMKNFNDSAVTYDQTGFWFDSSDYSTELTAISNDFTTYSPQLLSGSVDVDSTLAAFNKALKNDGIQTVLDGINDQYKTFLSSKS